MIVKRTTALYGKFDFSGPSSLLAALENIEAEHFGEKAFSAYVIHRSGKKHYGLRLSEWQSMLKRSAFAWEGFSVSASTTAGKVLRVHVRRDEKGKATGRFIIAAGSPEENQKIQLLLSGEKGASPTPTVVTDYTPSAPSAGSESIPKTQRWLGPQPASGRTYRRPAITLFDAFYFDRNVDAEGLISLINRLSNEYLGGEPFHLRLETTDGDYHLNVGADELRYLFNYRKDTFYLLYLDAATLDGQWINLRLSFHPLIHGPNAEMEVTSYDVDGATALITESIGLVQELDEPVQLNEAFSFDPGRFSVSAVINLLYEIGRDYLHKIPPVAFLATTEGQSYTGLSLYQLVKVWKKHAGHISILSLGITKLLTRQNLSIMFHFGPVGRTPFCTLSMMWGDPQKHKTVQVLVCQRLGLGAPLLSPPSGPPAHSVKACLINLPWSLEGSEQLEGAIAEAFRRQGIRMLSTEGVEDYARWPSSVSALMRAEYMIADISFRDPDVLYIVGMAQAMGKAICLLQRDDQALPASFGEEQVILYKNSEEGRIFAANELLVVLNGEKGAK